MEFVVDSCIIVEESLARRRQVCDIVEVLDGRCKVTCGVALAPAGKEGDVSHAEPEAATHQDP